ncbi:MULTISPECIES: DUF1700 domain-containing protein [unclassified Paenibacillus]|uniref:DUF1700 domain-containing protein n=1 Tax=unclassified Paenibacillus TaxID=185978 RepID=UPI002F3F5984
MNKPEFFQQLNKLLAKLPHNERQEILQDYEEYFTFGLHDGKTEEQMISALGSPKQISKELLAAYHIERATSTTTAGNMLRATWAVIGLGFFNLIIVLAPFAALLGLVVAGWLAGISFVLAPLFFLFNIIIDFEMFNLFELFISLALCGLGFFIIIGMVTATRAINNSFIKYLKFNMRLVKGGLQDE